MKYRVIYHYTPASLTMKNEHNYHYEIQRRKWFLFIPYWSYDCLANFETPLEAQQFEDQLNNQPVRTGQHF